MFQGRRNLLNRLKTGVFKSPVLFCALVVTLLLSQAVDLVHHHDDSLSKQVDCEICLNLGSTGNTLSASISLPLATKSGPQAYNALTESPVVRAASPRSRSPPSLA